MAISILNNSPLQLSGNYYLNNPDFNSRLFFTDTNITQSFIICRYDWDDSVWKVIYNGKLQGYQSNSTYQYRFDFDKYIKVEQPREFNFQMFGDFENILYQNINKMTSKVSIVLNGTNDILTTYTTQFETKSNGEVWLVNDPDALDFYDANTVFNYSFIDKSDSNMTPYPTIKSAIAQTWLPITTYSSSSDNQTYVILYDYDGVEIAGHSIWSDETGVGKQFMFYIPANAHTIELSTALDPSVVVIPIRNECTNPFYYYSSNGTLDIIYLFGNQHPVEETTKEYLTVGNNKYLTKLNTSKRIRQNSGFKLTQDQVFDFIKSPYAFSAYDGKLEMTGRNFLNNSQHPTWNDNISNIRITRTLMSDEAEQYMRIQPGRGYLINLYGMYYEYLDSNYYIASCMVRQNSGGSIIYRIYESPQDQAYTDFTVPSGVWTKIYTKAYESIAGDGKNIKIVQQSPVSAVGLDIKNCQIELENENYITYESGIGYLYKLEKDGIPTEWKPSLLDSLTNTVKLKRWMIDNNTFDGYVGSRYSEKNIEFTLIDEKTYKRNTNVKLGFFD